ncbi:pyridoxamine 5'-phosphate oxidase family protein [Actinoplanes sp. NEAU-A12]|uniref:Pyridoxamine 5'-phosphate oxidase family protein n=1 Tax=Actinoplanes sandaracinus TaxID=3045177 RepID=A0ABT6WCB0_9ACTN|nr:pyridoxamine 5'-phosphate oxidase family protein [Actinoplanes sandaracinus]MDI6097353.1 pyridoxamine 5'-phosphate oxidase family protein [Actinoplanes sandaracinus]
MNHRETVTMTPGEVGALLAYARKVQIATINPDGTPHLVTMFFGLAGGRIAFWTYRTSQKARNLARDRRLTCLVEDGEDYFALRGAQVNGVVEPIDDLAGVTEVGRLIAARMPDVPPDALDAYVTHAARKRTAYLVEPVRVASWDHRKLLP